LGILTYHANTSVAGNKQKRKLKYEGYPNFMQSFGFTVKNIEFTAWPVNPAIDVC